VGTSPIDFALLGGTGNRLKSKTKAKLKEKQTLIAMVQDPLLMFAIFLAPPSFSLQTTFKGTVV
jgi:hypothetical protein